MARTQVNLSAYVMITVVSRRGDEVFVQDLNYDEAVRLKNNRKDWKHQFYQQGFTSEKSNVAGLGFTPVPPPPLPKI